MEKKDRGGVETARSDKTAEAGMVKVVEGAGKWRIGEVCSGEGGWGEAVRGRSKTGSIAERGSPLPCVLRVLSVGAPDAVSVLRPAVLTPCDTWEP